MSADEGGVGQRVTTATISLVRRQVMNTRMPAPAGEVFCHVIAKKFPLRRALFYPGPWAPVPRRWVTRPAAGEQLLTVSW